MKPHFTLVPLLLIIASIGIAFGNLHYDAPPLETEPATIEHVHEHAHPGAHAALAEMTVHAVHHLGNVTLHAETFHDDPQWTPDYHLQWVAAETATGIRS